MTRRGVILVVSGLFFLALVGAGVWQFTRPIEPVTWIVLHLTIDETLSPDGSSELWLGDERLDGNEAWLEVSSSSRRRFEISAASDPFLCSPATMARACLPEGVSIAPHDEDAFRQVMSVIGEYPGRAVRGTAVAASTPQHWLCVVVSEPGEPPCGLAFRARHGGVELVDRDVWWREQPRDLEWERWLLRRRVTERILEIRFAARR